MLRIFLILFIFNNMLFSIEIKHNLEIYSLKQNEITTYIDEKNDKSIEYILNHQENFKNINQNYFNPSNMAIWTKINFKNPSQDDLEFYMINDFSAMDEIDIYIIKNNTLYDVLYFGDTRSISKEEILNRFTNVKIKIEKNNEIEIIIKYHSTSPINTNIKILSKSFYNNFTLKDSTIWGFFIGISSALILYNLMIFISLKEKAFLFYILNALTNTYNTLIISGYIYSILPSSIPIDYINILYKITPSLGIIFMSLFITHFFDLKKGIKWLYIMNLCVIYFLIFFMLSLIYFIETDNLIIYNKITSILVFISLLLMLFSAIVVVFKRLVGSLYFIFGSGILAISMLIYVLYFFGKVDFGLSTIYSISLGRTIDIIFLSMALGQKIKYIESQRIENGLLIEESNKFNSTSYLLASILHQFKQPIIYLGSEILNLRVLNYKKNEKDNEEDSILTNMENQITNMNELVENFYDFYSNTTSNNNFDLENSITKTLNILTSSLNTNNIEIIKNYEITNIVSNEKILNQVILIIIENAIGVLVERKIKEPKIYISTFKNNNSTEITIADNAGGIKENDLNKIFTVHYTNKKEKGLGIGLALAKNLITSRLNGKIFVSNTEIGASFKINL